MKSFVEIDFCGENNSRLIITEEQCIFHFENVIDIVPSILR